MSRLILVYDPEAKFGVMDREMAPLVKQACLDIPDDIGSLDLYEIARKLAELLLENLGR